MSKYLYTSALLASAAISQQAWAQDIPVKASIGLTPTCAQVTSPGCAEVTIVDNAAPVLKAVSTLPTGGTQQTITVDRTVTFDGSMSPYSIKTTASYTSYYPFNANYSPVQQVNGAEYFNIGVYNPDITASGSYDITGDIIVAQPFLANPNAINYYAGEGLAATNQTLNVKTLVINDSGSIRFNPDFGVNYKIASDGIVVDNQTIVSGTFKSGSDEHAALVFGTISGTAAVNASTGPLVQNYPSVSPTATDQGYSPYQLDLNLNYEVKTVLDENGLVTPKIAVTGGIDMGGSKITNLAAGTSDGDAVNYAQLSALSAKLTSFTSSEGPLVLGSQSSATGTGAVALGFRQVATGNGAVALGDPNTATGTGALAIGAENTATGDGAVALGNSNMATGNGTVAIGNGSSAAQAGAVALGNGASATAANSVALGSGSVATVADTVSVGSSGQQRKVVYVAAGNVAAGSTDAVNGGQLFSLTGRVNNLESFARDSRGEARHGIAAAMAMANAPMPSAPGRTSWAFNLANFKNAQAGSFAMTHRFETENPFALSGGVSYSGSDVGVRVGLSGEF